MIRTTTNPLGRRFIGTCPTCGWTTRDTSDKTEAQDALDLHHMRHEDETQ